jgi:hypothetical protein
MTNFDYSRATDVADAGRQIGPSTSFNTID